MRGLGEGPGFSVLSAFQGGVSLNIITGLEGREQCLGTAGICRAWSRAARAARLLLALSAGSACS